MKKDEVALEIRDGSEALRYSGKKRALIRLFIYLDYITYFFFFSTWYVGGELDFILTSLLATAVLVH